MIKFFYVTLVCLFQLLLVEDDLLFTINYRSPYGCSHQVTIKENGEGIIEIGRESNYDKEELIFEQIIKKEEFKVNNKDLGDLKELISSISVPLKKVAVNDGFRYSLISNHNQLIDVYGESPIVINEISTILKNYYSFEIDYFCEKYLEIF